MNDETTITPAQLETARLLLERSGLAEPAEDAAEPAESERATLSFTEMLQIVLFCSMAAGAALGVLLAYGRYPR